MKFCEVFENYLQEAEKNRTLSIATINNYLYEYKRHLENKKEFVQKEIEDIKDRDVIRLIKSLVLPKGSIEQARLTVVKVILRHTFAYAFIELTLDCLDIKIVLSNLTFPADYFKCPAVKNKRQVFTIEEIVRLKEGLRNTKDLQELGLLLCLTTGLRIGELCVLQKENVKKDFIEIVHSEHSATISNKTEYFIGLPKGGKTRRVYLTQDAQETLQQILQIGSTQYLFPSGNTWTRSYSFRRTLLRVCKRLDLPLLSPHKLRKTNASALLAQGVPEKVVQQQLGHSRIETTRQAYYYNILDTQQQINALKDVKIG